MRLVRIVLCAVCFICSISGLAQKRQIQVLKDQIKAGKEVQKVENTLRTMLTDSTVKTNKKIWLLICEALSKQYDQTNEYLYLNQKGDTAALFSITKRLYVAAAKLDSLESEPDNKGRIHIKYRVKHALLLNSIRPNLFSGGVFFIHKENFKEAYDYFDQYLLSADYPILEKYDYLKKDLLIPHAAYWSMYCGYKLKDSKRIMKYKNIAERDTSMLNFVKQYEAEAYLINKDTINYVNALKSGFEQYPNFDYFFPRLVEYYAQQGAYESVLNVADKALKADTTSLLFLFAKSTALLNLGRYPESIVLCEKIIEKNDKYQDAYYNAGLAYFNQAIALNKDRKNYKKNKDKILEFYTKALPFLEKYREFVPNAQDKWLAPLYTIYLNLNMGDNFEEVDKLRKQQESNER